MSNAQLYFAVGIPGVLSLINLAVMLVLFSDLSRRISRVEERIDQMIGAINDLDKRLTRVEIKLKIQD